MIAWWAVSAHFLGRSGPHLASVKRHPELLTGRHDELTPMVLADVKQAASERALK
jgi:hypothetical protein